MPSFECDVLVVGAGPSGLILALCLAMSEPFYRVGRRGAGITPRTLEVFKILGILPEVLKLAHNPVQFQSYELPGGVKPLKTWSMSPKLEPTPACPFVRYSRFSTLNCLANVSDSSTRYFSLNTAPIGFVQHADRVSARLSNATGGEDEINVKYLVGADGAKGIVRKQLGLPFLGETRTDEQLVVSDVIMEGLDLEHIHMWTKPAILAWPGQAKEANLFSVQIVGKEIDRQKIISDPEEFRRFFRTHTGREDVLLKEVVWVSEYTPNIRMVDRLEKERVFVVGGHEFSVQDSFNLGWKLAYVVLSLSTSDLLSTYTEERLPVVAEMLDKTTELHKSTFKADALDDRSHWQLNYRWSSIVFHDPQQHKRQYARGVRQRLHRTISLSRRDRAPDAPGLKEVGGDGDGDGASSRSLFDIFKYTTHTVLIFCPQLDQSTINTISVVIYPSSGSDFVGTQTDLTLRDDDGHSFRGYCASMDRLSCVVVRPDGMVGAMVSDLLGLKKYFDTILC
ncbi:FAD binding domain-containing protein [Mycena sp. CBHHK59/15]|nr:FAD binding domain-containing protein [Mycena sp. CBHHK59/15]